MRGHLILLVGPSGVGKGTVISYLKKKFTDFVYPVSYTTRSIRPREQGGEVYHFISKVQFEQGIKDDLFLEYAVVHSDNYYGTSKKDILESLEQGKTVVREIDIQGLQSIYKLIPKEQVTSIFLTVPSWEILRGRIMRRHPESEVELEQRRISYEREMNLRQLCDFEVESYEGDVERCVAEVEGIIRSEVRG